MREQVRGSLDRLMSQNYIGRTGEVYNFLTDEEQDFLGRLLEPGKHGTLAAGEMLA